MTEVEQEEREKIKESIRLRKEKDKLGGSYILVHNYERAELVCNKCGLVVDADFIDRDYGSLFLPIAKEDD